MSLSSPARSSAVSDLFTPPGTEPVPCTRLPAVMRITSWPYLRSSTPFLAISGCAATTPTMLRWATSEPKPNSRSGEDEVEEVQGVRLQDLAVVHQAADLFRGRRQLLDAQHHVQRLRCGEVVRDRADAAQALHHDRHFPVGAALDELFEAAEFDDVQAHLLHLVVVVEQDGDLAVALDARHGIDGDAAQLFGVRWRFRVRMAWRTSCYQS